MTQTIAPVCEAHGTHEAFNFVVLLGDEILDRFATLEEASTEAASYSEFAEAAFMLDPNPCGDEV